MSSQSRDLNARAIPAKEDGLALPEQEAAPHQEDALGPAATETKVAVAGQWQLMRWKFKRHKLAVVSLWIIAFLYLIALFVEFLAPADPEKVAERYKYLSPRGLSFINAEGNFSLRPGVYGLASTRNPETLRVLTPDKTKWYPIHFFVRGDEYKMWGFIKSDRHLFGLGNKAAEEQAPFFLMGSDRLGRDMLSRIIYGTRISLSIGLLSVAASLIFGIILGGISGYFGGAVDNTVQRIIEFVRSIPQIPIWLAIAAALPTSWGSIRIFFVITLILSLLSWTSLARVVRGRFLSLREEDFVMAARFAGASEARIIFRHMVPSFLSHIIATLTLNIPQIILFETSLSFLGLGLRPPVISWGVLLQEAQNVQTVALSPWLLAPGVIVVVAVLSFNFMGDGMRDAADPYSR
ncbi:MAG: ABC transporter permease [Thermomicrobiales bacterium]